MARANRTPSGKHSSAKPRPSASKANAAGYEKRQSRKAKALHALQPSDVYEYASEKNRRSNVALDLDRDEAAEFGGGMGDEEREELRARLIGEHDGDDGALDSGDDEEIDSDAAFEESDEDRFAGFFSTRDRKKSKAKSKAPSVRFADVDLNEDGDGDMGGVEEATPGEEEEGEDDEFINVLDVLDGKGEPDISDAEEAPPPARARARAAGPADPVDSDNEDQNVDRHDDSDSELGEEDGSDMDTEDDDEDLLAPSDTDDIPSALDDLQNFISTLDPSSKKRKAPTDTDGPSDPSRSHKRRLIKERTESGVENEFRAQASGGSKLNLEDLLAPLASKSSTLLSLKKSTKALLPSSSSKSMTLSAPLPQRAQERLDREAAYEQTKGEVDKWSGTMKRIREAEHLSFPLQAERPSRVSNLELASKFKPTTALESSVDALLRSAKIREEDLGDTEAAMLQTNKLSVEEVAERRGELRKMRDLMFRAEIKARRVNKIKSKTFRKLKRKERERLGGKSDDEGGEGEEEKLLKREVERAKERATLRHKHTGKWAKQMRGKEGIGEEGRREIEEMLDRGEKLRRKIQGVGSNGSGAEESDEDDEGGDLEGGVEKIKKGAFDELERIEAEEGEAVDSMAKSGKGKSVFEMKFMKDAMARQQVGADKMVDDFIKEMGGEAQNGSESDNEDAATDEVDPSHGVLASRAGGRVVYRPGPSTNNNPKPTRLITSLPSDTSSVTLRSTDLLTPPPPSPEQFKRSAVQIPATDDSNPWLVPAGPGATFKAPRKKNEVVVAKESATLEKSKNKLRKLARKREEERAEAKNDAQVEISTQDVLTLGTGPAGASSGQPKDKDSKLAPKKKEKVKGIVAAEGDDSDANSEVDEQEKVLDTKGKLNAKGIKAFEQRDLVALAFAGDNVVQEFEEQKRRAIAEDAPREVDTTLAGWGSWGGMGVRRTAPKPHLIKKIAGIDPSTRADFNKAHVIISEKRDKKAAKYMVKDLPYPYTSKAQFERTMEQPLGKEWNTRVGFQRATLPRVVKKPGVIINPLEKLN